MSQGSKLWSKPFTAILVMAFFFFVSLQMLTTGFPAFITDTKQNPTQGGLMTTVFMIAAILTRPLISYYMQKVNIKVMSIFSLLFIVVTIGLSLGQESVGYLLFLRFLHGIGFGMITTILATAATSIIPSSRLGEGVGYYSLATSVGTATSPMFALAIIQVWSFNLLLVISVLLSAITLMLSFLLKGQRKSVAEGNPIIQSKQKIKLKDYLFEKAALLPCLLAAFFTVTLGGVMSFMAELGKEANIESEVPLFFLVMAVFMTVIRPISGRLFDRVGHKYIIYPSIISGIIGLILLAFTQNTLMLLFAGAFYGLAYGTATPSLQAIAVGKVNREKQSTANAMYYSAMDIGMAVGSTGLGILATYTNFHMMFGISIIFLILFIMIYTLKLVQIEKRKKLNLLKGQNWTEEPSRL